MLCTNVAEVLAVAAASLVGAPLPLRPLQILYLNVLTDVFPALALGVGPGPPGVMDRPPRSPGESVLTSSHWRAVGGWSTLIGACVLGALALALEWLGLEEPAAVTVSFLTLAFTKLWFVFVLRAKGTPILDNEVVRNPWVWGALALCAGLLLAAVYVPVLSAVLSTTVPGWSGWGLVLALSLVPLVVGQLLHLHSARRARGMEKGRRDAGPGVKSER
jgi:Ca2+-transporting ATPase